MQERLQKILARAGLCSRRAAEKLIDAGRVEVGGKVVREQGTKVDPAQDEVRVDGRKIELAAPAPLTLATYKPVWMLTTWSDPRGRPTVRELVQDLGVRLFPVGRLDFDAEGLLLLTNDGELTHHLTHPRFGVRRTYLVKIEGRLAAAEVETLRAGVTLDDGPVRPIEVTEVPHPGAAAEGSSWWRVGVAEGRNHLVKRLMLATGHTVQRLVRAEYSGVTLGSLRPGQRRKLTVPEVARLGGAGGEREPQPYPGALLVPPSALRAPAAHRRPLPRRPATD
ncbi:MAG: pseudouridine synthase [Myxococcales bacterium]